MSGCFPNADAFTYWSAAAWHIVADSPPDAEWGHWRLWLSPVALLPSGVPVYLHALVTSDQHQSGSSKRETQRLVMSLCNTIYSDYCPALIACFPMLHLVTIKLQTCSFRAWEAESSFCCKDKTAVSCCSFMMARSRSCCSRALESVSERQSSSICCFMLSTAASATFCFFKFCKHNKTTVYTKHCYSRLP